MESAAHNCVLRETKSIHFPEQIQNEILTACAYAVTQILILISVHELSPYILDVLHTSC